MIKKIGIYKITSPTGRIYIGQSINIEKRFLAYKKLNCDSQPKLKRSLLKYGYINHIFEIIEDCPIELLNDRERYYQEQFNCLIHGLNCMLVGTELQTAVRSEETKKKIGDFNRGRKRPKHECEKISRNRMGMKFSPEHCENIRLSKTGPNNKRSVKVISILTGEIYHTIKSAADANGLDHRTLSRYLNGTRTNKSHLKYA
jgi:group I intron endonuclease